jgi:hypothetical protein
MAARAASGQDADDHLRLDLRAERIELSVQTGTLGAVKPYQYGPWPGPLGGQRRQRGLPQRTYCWR